MKDPIKQSLDKIRLIESEENTGYSWNQFSNDVKAAGKGALHGYTGGIDDNALAAVYAITGNEPNYKTALQNQMANTANVKANSSNFGKSKFNVYDAGDLAGTAAMAFRGPFSSNPSKVGKVSGILGSHPAGIAANLIGSGGAHIIKKLWDKHVTGTKASQGEIDQLARMSPEKIAKIQDILGVERSGEVDVATLKGIEKYGSIPKLNDVKESDELILDEALEELNLRLFEKIFEDEIMDAKIPSWVSKLFGKSDKPNSIIARNLDEPVKTATPDPKLGNLEPVAGKPDPKLGNSEPVAGKPDPKLGNSEPVAGGRQDPKWIPDPETQAQIDAARAANPPPRSPWDPGPEVQAIIDAEKAAKRSPEIPKAGTPVPGKPGWVYTGKTNPNGNGRPMVKKQATTEPAAELPKSTAEPKPFQPGKRASEKTKSRPAPTEKPDDEISPSRLQTLSGARKAEDETGTAVKAGNEPTQTVTTNPDGTTSVRVASDGGSTTFNFNIQNSVAVGQQQAEKLAANPAVSPGAAQQLGTAVGDLEQTGKISKILDWIKRYKGFTWAAASISAIAGTWTVQQGFGPYSTNDSNKDETPPATAPTTPAAEPTTPAAEPAAEPAPEGAPSAADLKKRISELTVREQKSTDPEEKNIIKQLIRILNLPNPDEKDLEQRSALEDILATHFKPKVDLDP